LKEKLKCSAFNEIPAIDDRILFDPSISDATTLTRLWMASTHTLNTGGSRVGRSDVRFLDRSATNHFANIVMITALYQLSYSSRVDYGNNCVLALSHAVRLLKEKLKCSAFNEIPAIDDRILFDPSISDATTLTRLWMASTHTLNTGGSRVGRSDVRFLDRSATNHFANIVMITALYQLSYSSRVDYGNNCVLALSHAVRLLKEKLKCSAFNEIPAIDDRILFDPSISDATTLTRLWMASTHTLNTGGSRVGRSDVRFLDRSATNHFANIVMITALYQLSYSSRVDYGNNCVLALSHAVRLLKEKLKCSAFNEIPAIDDRILFDPSISDATTLTRLWMASTHTLNTGGSRVGRSDVRFLDRSATNHFANIVMITALYQLSYSSRVDYGNNCVLALSHAVRLLKEKLKCSAFNEIPAIDDRILFDPSISDATTLTRLRMASTHTLNTGGSRVGRSDVRFLDRSATNHFANIVMITALYQLSYSSRVDYGNNCVLALSHAVRLLKEKLKCSAFNEIPAIDDRILFDPSISDATTLTRLRMASTHTLNTGGSRVGRSDVRFLDRSATNHFANIVMITALYQLSYSSRVDYGNNCVLALSHAVRLLKEKLKCSAFNEIPAIDDRILFDPSISDATTLTRCGWRHTQHWLQRLSRRRQRVKHTTHLSQCRTQSCMLSAADQHLC
jgi:hypothetical protein